MNNLAAGQLRFETSLARAGRQAAWKGLGSERPRFSGVRLRRSAQAAPSSQGLVSRIVDRGLWGRRAEFNRLGWKNVSA